jgi:hypothetical protein
MFDLEKDNYTKEEVTKLLQSETDKVRTEYVKKVKELESKLPPEKSEKELELEKKEQELLAKEREFKIRETLEKNQLPAELAKFLSTGEDIESVVNELSEVLNKHMLNNSYKPTNKKNNDGISKEQFAKMGYIERMNLFENNPELYSKLSK